MIWTRFRRLPSPKVLVCCRNVNRSVVSVPWIFIRRVVRCSVSCANHESQASCTFAKQASLAVIINKRGSCTRRNCILLPNHSDCWILTTNALKISDLSCSLLRKLSLKIFLKIHAIKLYLFSQCYDRTSSWLGDVYQHCAQFTLWFIAWLHLIPSPRRSL